MISITDKSLCCGCSACASRCPKSCIAMLEDSEGFLYPEVDKGSCVDCGICEDVCHEIHPSEERKPLVAFAAQCEDDGIREKSSSGGVFTLLAENMIRRGGIVFGARFDSNWQVMLDYTESIEGIALFRKSKYVQARTENAYVDCERFLKNEREVLFTGTPCQIAGLLKFLRRPYSNLLTVDVACHGVPSPKIWSVYLASIKDVFKKGSPVTVFSELKAMNYSVWYKEDEKILVLRAKRHENAYMNSFIYSRILRPSCYNCNCKSFRSNSDITIADFWGISNIVPNFSDGRGANLVIVNTSKGKSELERLSIQKVEADMDASIKNNPALTKSSPRPVSREDLFADMNETVLMQKMSVLQHKQMRNNQNLVMRHIKNVLKSILAFSQRTKSKINDTNIKSPNRFTQIMNHKIADGIMAVDFRDKSNGWVKYGLLFLISLKEN